MLSGEFLHNIDAKGRVTIPAKFREQLGENFVITKGFDNCLFLYPMREWEKFEEKLASLNVMSKDVRDLNRFFLGGAVECDFDSMGRVLISQSLKEHAMLKKEVVLVGIVNRIEIWDRSSWDKINKNTIKNMEEIASRLDDIGLSI